MRWSNIDWKEIKRLGNIPYCELNEQEKRYWDSYQAVASFQRLKHDIETGEAYKGGGVNG